MVTIRRDWKTPTLLVVLLLVLSSNLVLYRLPVTFLPVPHEATGVVIGSFIDFALVAPLLLLFITREKGFTVKRFITFMVIGIVVARFIIPTAYFAPFKYVPYIAIGIEGAILFAEIGLILLLMKHFPRIIKEVRASGGSPLYSFPEIIEKKVGRHSLVNIISAELLMFYYAFASWKKTAPTEEDHFTLHQKTSFVAFYIMLIHAIVIETIGIHWWLHEKALILSVVLLLLNVYSVIFLIGDIQAVRLNPLIVNKKQIRVSLGLGKRMTIPFNEIEQITWGDEAAKENLKSKEIIDFIARDFENVLPQCIITFKRPLRAKLFLGFEKQYSQAALRVDEPERFRQHLEKQMMN